ncbi:Metallo-dependent phosphatase-like protein [Lipomyces tetrasporus]|uniref:Purple acid phosphatase n=1 Tax=Lipomyces tetrasporus TaxID=54092 RepID=A0AAD7VT29_9ASCO|nr:Metallo-dependent phosphatase-like protein [Lipomyces tetrasporus]KAJ8101707.1 Metallo-dependent phosphatase-like protein [Lipomyces tetrasporus]
MRSIILGALALASSVLAQINVPGVVPINPAEPLQHHLAYAGVTGMTVSWNTYEEISNPTVYYGTDSWDLSSYATGESVTYPTSLTWSNHVKITGLKPNTQYYYIVSNTNCYNCSELAPYTFTTARVAGDRTPYTVAVTIDLGVMGDLGLSTTSKGPITSNDQTTIQSLARYMDGFDFLWHPGDIAYADYWLKEQIQSYLPAVPIDEGYKMYNRLLNTFYDELQPITAQKPYMVGPGNHEANCDNGGTTDKVNNITYTVDICMEGQRNFTGFTNHFRMPSAESGGVENFWYSFDHGMVHFVQIDTETDLGNGIVGPDEAYGSEGDFDTIGQDAGPFGTKNQQMNWLTKDLASVDRTKTPWIVVSGHRPFYAASHENGRCDECVTAFEPILLKYNVDLVLAGHVHFYERNAPIANGTADPNELNNPSAPWYIMNGAAGHYDGLDPIEGNPDYIRYVQNSTYGWSKLTFHNCTHMTHEFVISGNGTVLDTATLYKNHGCPMSNYTGTNSSAPITDHNGSASLKASAALFAVVLATALMIAL